MAEVVTRKNCEVILQNYLKSTNYQIEDYNVDSLASTVSGMMAEYHLLTIKYKIGDKSSSQTFFCKKLVMFHKIQEIMLREQDGFEKEDYAYNYLIKGCKNVSNFKITYAPECYLSLKDDIFVLEDLITLGYVTRRKTHDMAHCKIALKAIADFHATTIIYEQTQSIKTGTKFCLYTEHPEIFRDSLYRKQEDYLGRKWFKNCLNTCLKISDICKLPNIDNEKLKEKIRIYSEKVYEIVQPSKHYMNVVCHGDLAPVNILFKYDDQKQISDCKLVDYQALRYTPPAHDVMNYIYLNTDSVFRKKHMNELLEYYHKIFHLELERYNINKDKHIVLERFHESCEYVLPQVIIQNAFYATMFPINFDFPEIKKDQELYKKYVYEDRSPQCLEIYKYGGMFKDTIDDMFYELYDM